MNDGLTEPRKRLLQQNFTNGKVSLEGKKEVGRGKVPFDPYQRFVTLMDGEWTTVFRFLCRVEGQRVR